MLRFIAGTVFLLFPMLSTANNLTVSLLDQKQKPLKNAVVLAIPLNPIRPQLTPKQAIITQRNKTFVPLVSVFPKGTVATFLNQDTVKHHVYSFSSPKKFEIKLYSGKPAKKITFDRVGMVTFGCNIHDDMLSYAFVVDTPYYTLSNASGRAVLKGLPTGQYLLKVQHPLQKKKSIMQKRINLPSKLTNFSFQLALKPQWSKRKKKKANDVIYDESQAN